MPPCFIKIEARLIACKGFAEAFSVITMLHKDRARLIACKRFAEAFSVMDRKKEEHDYNSQNFEELFLKSIKSIKF